MIHENAAKTVLTEVYTQKKGTCVTVIILGIIIGIFGFAYITFGNEPVANSQNVNRTLQLVNIIINEGQNHPTFDYPNDPFMEDGRWQLGLGEVTKKGKQTLFNEGKYFRERYDNFLPDLYYPSDLLVLSSISDVCLTSAAVLLAGLYPPHKYQIWNPHIFWQPIPIKSISAEVDNVLDLTKSCPRLTTLIKELEDSYIQNDAGLTKLYDYLSEHMGLKVDNLTTILQTYNLLLAQEKQGLLLPEWTEPVYPRILLKYATRGLALLTETDEVTKLSTGELLKRVTNSMVKKNANKSNNKLFLYSAQEHAVFNFLRVIGDFDFSNGKPNASSAVIFELHNIENEAIVQVFYLDRYDRHPILINITSCGNPCALEDFVKYSELLTAENWDTACFNSRH